MDKSIETMWKQGFINEPQLSSPKVNDLYNRKSQNVVDKMQDMFAVNIKAIIIGALIILLVMSLIGAPFLGLYFCVLLTPLVLIAKRELNNSLNLSKGENSYDYLTSFNHWLNGSIEVFGNYYKYFYPLLLSGMLLQGVVSDAGGKVIALLIEWFPTSYMILGLPYYLIALIALSILIVTKYAKAIYLWDLNLVYGNQIQKLNELISDMEDLRK